jgi:hypothetical protein
MRNGVSCSGRRPSRTALSARRLASHEIRQSVVAQVAARARYALLAVDHDVRHRSLRGDEMDEPIGDAGR